MSKDTTILLGSVVANESLHLERSRVSFILLIILYLLDMEIVDQEHLPPGSVCMLCLVSFVNVSTFWRGYEMQLFLKLLMVNLCLHDFVLDDLDMSSREEQGCVMAVEIR